MNFPSWEGTPGDDAVPGNVGGGAEGGDDIRAFIVVGVDIHGQLPPVRGKGVAVAAGRQVVEQDGGFLRATH